MKYLILLLISLLLTIPPVLAQSQIPGDTNLPPDISEEEFPEPNETTEVLSLPLSRLEYNLSLFVLGFGVLLIFLEIFLIKSNRINPEEAVKFILVTIIIVSTLFLITAGYSNDQIAPAVGLLGTIAGYLLGRSTQTKKHENE